MLIDSYPPPFSAQWQQQWANLPTNCIRAWRTTTTTGNSSSSSSCSRDWPVMQFVEIGKRSTSCATLYYEREQLSHFSFGSCSSLHSGCPFECVYVCVFDAKIRGWQTVRLEAAQRTYPNSPGSTNDRQGGDDGDGGKQTFPPDAYRHGHWFMIGSSPSCDWFIENRRKLGKWRMLPKPMMNRVV